MWGLGRGGHLRGDGGGIWGRESGGLRNAPAMQMRHYISRGALSHLRYFMCTIVLGRTLISIPWI